MNELDETGGPTGSPREPRRLGVAMIGYAFMGQAHSQGWRNARSFFDPAVVPELRVVCGRNAEAAQDLARRFKLPASTQIISVRYERL